MKMNLRLLPQAAITGALIASIQTSGKPLVITDDELNMIPENCPATFEIDDDEGTITIRAGYAQCGDA